MCCGIGLLGLSASSPSNPTPHRTVHRHARQRFINAAAREEIIFTRGATEAINLVANTWGVKNLKPGDEILLTVMEHHSNLVPWQLVAERTGAVLKVSRFGLVGLDWIGLGC